MSFRQILIIVFILIALVIPLIELSIGFYYVNSISLCPMQHDIMILMAIGGVFNTIFLAAAFAFIFAITPARFKSEKPITSAEAMAKGSNRANQILTGKFLNSISSNQFSSRLYRHHLRYLCFDILRSVTYSRVQ